MIGKSGRRFFRSCATTSREQDHDPSAPQPLVHARIERAGAGKGPQSAGRWHHPRSRGFGGAGCQGQGTRSDHAGDRGERLRQARSPDPHQQPGYAVVDRRYRHGGQGRARRHRGSQGFQCRGFNGDRRSSRRRRSLDPRLGDDRDLARGAACRGACGCFVRFQDSCSDPTIFRGRPVSACSRAAR
jgi:hypothetical protein